MTVPKLRFKKFDGDWISENIQGLVDSKILDKPMDGNHGEIHPTSADYVDDGIPFVMATDIFNGQVYLNKSKKIPKTQADSLRKGFSLEGDILLTHKATIGNVAIVPKLNTPYVMLTPQVTYYRILNKEKLVPEFLKSNFESPYFQNELLALCTGATRLYIGISEQRKIPFRYCCTEEQTKIASFFSVVDEKISQLNQKHELLCQYKQGMMQKLFSQQLRFKADDGSEFAEWETKCLGDTVTTMQSGLSRQLHDEDIGLVVLRSNNVIDNKVSFEDVKFWYLNDPQGADVNNYLLDDGDILVNFINSMAQIGKSAIYRKNLDRKVICTTNILRIKADQKKVTSEFLNFIFQTNEYQNYIQSITKPAVNQASFTTKEFKMMIFKIPCLAEQTKIANFLSAIDQKIEVVAQQVAQAKQWKKGLLQQMFF